MKVITAPSTLKGSRNNRGFAQSEYSEQSCLLCGALDKSSSITMYEYTAVIKEARSNKQNGPSAEWVQEQKIRTKLTYAGLYGLIDKAIY